MISDYLHLRQQLVGLVLVMDSRHPLTPLDRQLLQFIRPTGKPLQVLLTKADKLTRSESSRVLARTVTELRRLGSDASVRLFSSLTLQGTQEAAELIAEWLGANRARRR